ncbi:MAG TPA: tyrosine-type recombinase/integrase [Solirubrobacteraceae bacterium]
MRRSMATPARTAYPALPQAIEAFRDTLIAKSPRTAINYASALARLREFLPTVGIDPDAASTDALPADVLERFYAWLLRTYGRERRTTAVAYAAEVRAFFRFLDRRRWLHAELSYERMKDGLRELIGRVQYKTPRVDDAIVAASLTSTPWWPPVRRGNAQGRLEVLRDKAILKTLYATALRRQEIARLNRTDVQDGRAREGLVTGKGDKERVVFFDEDSLAAIRAYLAARADAHLPLFLRHDDGRGTPGPRGERWRLSPQSVWLVVKKYGALAGVEVTTHHLRHLKARVLLNAGAELAEVQDILGHASPNTTKKIYAQYTKQHLREAFDKYSRPAAEVAGRSKG